MVFATLPDVTALGLDRFSVGHGDMPDGGIRGFALLVARVQFRMLPVVQILQFRRQQVDFR